MMDHHKEESSSKWFWIIALLLIGWGFLQAAFTDIERSYEYELEELPPAVEVSRFQNVTDVNDFFLARAELDHDTNTCIFKNNTIFSETVFVIYPDQATTATSTIGMWNPASSTISLMQPGGLNIQTVAHEVSHMVDTFMEKYPNVDPHYRAYMQGYWTDCVLRIMEHDIDTALIKKTRFP